jgi:hypothetical protein
MAFWASNFGADLPLRAKLLPLTIVTVGGGVLWPLLAQGVRNERFSSH